MKHRWNKKIAAVVIGITLLTCGVTAAAASQGSADNPLVTLSYLKNIYTSSVLAQTQTKIDSAQTQYQSALDTKIDTYTKEMTAMVQGANSDGSAVFSLVSLSSGQTLTGSVGCEVMLRVGSAACVSTESPGLIDSTAGTVLENGGALVKNHLYLVTVQNHAVKATSAVKVLVRGTYTVS